MRTVLKTLLVLLVVAALPLRAYATVAAELCATHHGGTQELHATEHDHAPSHQPAGQDNDHASTAALCSLCATCTVGASLAPDTARPLGALSAIADRIPFVDARRSGRVPERLDRPPLAL